MAGWAQCRGYGTAPGSLKKIFAKDPWSRCQYPARDGTRISWLYSRLPSGKLFFLRLSRINHQS